MEEKKALLIMDVQNGIVKMLPDSAALILAVGNAIEKARRNNIPVIYIVIGFRKGYPEVSMNNKSFSVIKGSNRNFDSEEAFRVYDSVAPREGDITVIKKRVSAFAGSDLEIVLRSLEIKQIVLAGISTSGVVLSTLREAADKDYAITILSDACADSDAEVHRMLTTKIFVKQADVMTTDEWNG